MKVINALKQQCFAPHLQFGAVQKNMALSGVLLDAPSRAGEATVENNIGENK